MHLFILAIWWAHLKPQFLVPDSAPWLPEHPPIWSRCARELAEIGPTDETEHRAASVARNRCEGRHHVAHALLVRGDEEHAEIVDAEVIVDHPRCNDLAIGADFRFDHALDAFGAGVGFDREELIVDAEERIRLDPFQRVRDRRHEDAQRLGKSLRTLGRVLDDVDVIAEAKVFRRARSDLDVERDLRRHVIVGEAKNARGRGAVAADARGAHPILRGYDTACSEQVFGVFAKAIHFVDEKGVGEFERLAQTNKPLAALVIEVGETIAGIARMTTIEGDKLLRSQLCMSAERLEDAENVVVGDHRVPAAWCRPRARAVLSRLRGFHSLKWRTGSAGPVNVRHVALCVAVRYSATACSLDHILSRCRAPSGWAALCRGMSRLAGAQRANPTKGEKVVRNSGARRWFSVRTKALSGHMFSHVTAYV